MCILLINTDKTEKPYMWGVASFAFKNDLIPRIYPKFSFQFITSQVN